MGDYWTENTEPDNYGYSGYGTGFDEQGKTVIVIFRVENSLSVHVDNRKNNIIILVERPPGELDDTAKTTETKYTVLVYTIMQPTFLCILIV